MEVNLVAFGQWLGIPAVSALAAWGAAYIAIKYASQKAVEQALAKDLKKFEHTLTTDIEQFKAAEATKNEAFKAVQAEYLERIKFDMSASLDRVSKLNEVQFEVYPEVWRLAQEAVYGVGDLIARARFGGGIGGMNAMQRAEMYERKEFLESERDLLEKQLALGPMQGQTTFNEIEDRHRLVRASRGYNDFNSYLRIKGIFIAPDLRSRLAEFATMMLEAIWEHQDDAEGDFKGMKSAERRRKRDAMNKAWDGIRVDLENDFYARLSGSDLTATPTPPSEEAPADKVE